MIRQLPPYWFTSIGNVQRRAVTQDSGGGAVTTYANYLTNLPMRVNRHGGTEKNGPNRLNTVKNYTIYVNGNPVPDIRATDRITVNSEVYDISNVSDPDSAGVFLKITAAKIAPEGIGA